MATYRIVRFTEGRNPVTIRRGLTLEQARDHCRDPKSASPPSMDRSRPAWFDGYEEEKEGRE